MAVRPQLTPTFCTVSYIYFPTRNLCCILWEIRNTLTYFSDSLPLPVILLVSPFPWLCGSSSAPRLSGDPCFGSLYLLLWTLFSSLTVISFSNLSLPCLKLLRSSLFCPLSWICELISSWGFEWTLPKTHLPVPLWSSGISPFWKFLIPFLYVVILLRLIFGSSPPPYALGNLFTPCSFR